MYHNNVTFELLTANRNQITEYCHEGKTYIEGRKGSEYKIKIRNNNYFSVLVVPSVDGLSVMDGKPADYTSSGYILHSHETIIVDGWRIDLESIRKFIFTRKNKSYSAKIHRGSNNLGVIGLAVFKEKPLLTYRYNFPATYTPYTPDTGIYSCFNIASLDSLPQNTSYTSTISSSRKNLSTEPLIAMGCAAPVPTVGTGMGNKKESRVVTASFDRADRPYLTMQLFYYERKQLEKMGVIQPYMVSETQRPNPFPQEQHPMQFCKEV